MRHVPSRRTLSSRPASRIRCSLRRAAAAAHYQAAKRRIARLSRVSAAISRSKPYSGGKNSTVETEPVLFDPRRQPYSEKLQCFRKSLAGKRPMPQAFPESGIARLKTGAQDTILPTTSRAKVGQTLPSVGPAALRKAGKTSDSTPSPRRALLASGAGTDHLGIKEQ